MRARKNNFKFFFLGNMKKEFSPAAPSRWCATAPQAAGLSFFGGHSKL